MKVKTKKVYYCEYCGRHRLTRHSIELHEKHCTLNPHRSCRMCDQSDLGSVIEKYRNRFRVIEKDTQFGKSQEIEWINGEVTLADIESDTDCCPACTLAVMRLCGFNKFPAAPFEFNYEEARKEWWDEKNANTAEDRGVWAY